MNSSTLSQILSGTRNVSHSLGAKICQQLALPDEIRNPLLLSIDDPRQFGDPHAETRTLTEEEMKALRDWESYAVLSAVDIPNIASTASDIAEHIGADRGRVQELLDFFHKMGVLRKVHEHYEQAGVRLTTTNRIPNEDLREAHRQWIEKSLNALASYPKRSVFFGITQAIPSKKLPEVERRVAEFSRSLAMYLDQSNEPDDQVFRMNIQFFPVQACDDSNRTSPKT